MSGYKRRKRQLTSSRYGKDRNHLARLLQERTGELNSYKAALDMAFNRIENIKMAVSTYNDIDIVRELVKKL